MPQLVDEKKKILEEFDKHFEDITWTSRKGTQDIRQFLSQSLDQISQITYEAVADLKFYNLNYDEKSVARMARSQLTSNYQDFIKDNETVLGLRPRP